VLWTQRPGIGQAGGGLLPLFVFSLQRLLLGGEGADRPGREQCPNSAMRPQPQRKGVDGAMRSWRITRSAAGSAAQTTRLKPSWRSAAALLSRRKEIQPVGFCPKVVDAGPGGAIESV
jgi:hypothetical protein